MLNQSSLDIDSRKMILKRCKRAIKNSIQLFRNSQVLMQKPVQVFQKALQIIKNEAQHDLDESKRVLSRLSKIYLKSLLTTNSTVEIPHVENPEVSIILVLYNRAELTLNCLYSILRSKECFYEIIIVDNNSTDETRLLLSRIKGAKIIQNTENVHFLLACNQASKIASGDHILFLNNDAQILADSINSALKTIKASEDIGAVGGKIVFPNGTLQEAGSIIWQDGFCSGYGRGDDPYAPQYMFKRDVDYCSGAFLLTKRELFMSLGGFDEDYKPAYYEETDYCVRLWKSGKRIVYDPNVVILHYEFASSASKTGAVELQIRNRRIFAEKHKDWLESHYPASQEDTLRARSARSERKKILFIEDRVPHLSLGAGFPRANHILAEMVNLECHVTFYPLWNDKDKSESWEDIYSDIPLEVEVMKDYHISRLEDFLHQRKDFYDLIFISRPYNMAELKSILSVNNNLINKTKIVYDAEALFCLREISCSRLREDKISEEHIQEKVSDELRLTEGSSAIVSVSEAERNKFIQYGFNKDDVYVLGHTLECKPTSNLFEFRENILFVGALDKILTPNSDSVVWFSKEILPILIKKLNKNVKLFVVGRTCPEIEQLASESIKVMGKVDDLTSLYDSARLFVAPTRFAAGVPFKVHEAAARGLPVVTTSLIANQLGWQRGVDLLVADDPESFADKCIKLYQDSVLWNSLRSNALNRVSEDCSPARFSKTLEAIISHLK